MDLLLIYYIQKAQNLKKSPKGLPLKNRKKKGKKTFQLQSVTNMKTTKITKSFNKNKNKARLISNPYHKIKQIRTKTCHVWTKI